MLVKALVSFNGVVKGDVGHVDDTAQVRGYVTAGYLEVIDSGTDQDRPGGPSKGDQGGQFGGAAYGGPTSDQPGEDPGTGGYGQAQGSDQGQAEA